MPPSICGICKKECTSVTCLLKWFVLLKSSSSIETLVFVSRLAFLKAYAYLKLFGCLTLYIFDSKHFDFRIDVLENLRLSTFSIFLFFEQLHHTFSKQKNIGILKKVHAYTWDIVLDPSTQKLLYWWQNTLYKQRKLSSKNKSLCLFAKLG